MAAVRIPADYPLAKRLANMNNSIAAKPAAMADGRRTANAFCPKARIDVALSQ